MRRHRKRPLRLQAGATQPHPQVIVLRVLAPVVEPAMQLQVRSGVFLSGIRRIGKTTFLRQGLNVGAAGFSFGFQVDTVGKPGGATLSEVFTELVDKVKTNVVLILDEMQQALGTEEGNNLLFALKALWGLPGNVIR